MTETSTQKDILLVEDNPDDALFTMRALSKSTSLGRIYWVKDGADAIDYLMGTGPFSKFGPSAGGLRVVFLDLKLQRVHGLEVLKRIKTDPAYKLLPVVILTSSEEKKDIEACYRLGANSYVVKPIEVDEFSKTVGAAGSYWMRINRSAIIS